MNKKIVLITGGSGFIGSNLSEYYIRDGWVVVNIDKNLPNQSVVKLGKSRGNSYHYYQCDLRDIKQTSEILQILKNKVGLPDVISHHASSTLDNLIDSSDNIGMTSNLISEFELIFGHGTKMIFASSAAIYGDGLYHAALPDTKYKSTSYYGWSKQTLEYLLSNTLSPTWSVSIFRYSNVYGKFNANGIIPKYMKGLVEYFNGDPSKLIRDYIHVNDVCSINVELSNNWRHGIWNVSTSFATTLSSLISKLHDRGVTKIEGIRQDLPERLMRSTLDNFLTKSEFKNWNPISVDTGLDLLFSDEGNYG